MNGPISPFHESNPASPTIKACSAPIRESSSLFCAHESDLPNGNILLSVKGRMRKPRSTLLFFVLLVLGLSLTVPVEDLPETPYDESETSPYLSIPLLSNLVSQAAASVTGVVRRAVDLRSGSPFRFAVTRASGTDRHRSAEERVALALLCTLLC
jgi:hypothetical protein